MAAQSDSASTLPGHEPAPVKGLAVPAAGVAASAAMLFWGTGLHPLWWLMGFAPLPVLLLSPRLTGRRAFVTASLAWFLGTLNLWPYLLRVLGLPIPLVLVFSVVPSCVFGIAARLFRRFVLRGAVARAALIFPAFWVTWEYIDSVLSPHGTFLNVGYTQANFLPLLQAGSLAGIWAITFCLFLLPATIAGVLSGMGRGSQKAKLAAASGAFLALVIGWGAWRTVSIPAAEHTVKVGLTATGVGTAFPFYDASAMKLLQEYADSAVHLASLGAEVVVLPEKIAVVSDAEMPQVDAIFADASARAKAIIIAGLDRGTLKKRVNEARLYSPGKGLAAVYAKHHLVPGFEAVDEPGTAITVLDQPSGIWGMQICKDLDFPALSRRYGAERTGLLLVPAWDFTLDGWLHDRMAVMRGVESGFTVVRAAKQGLLSVSDDRGRILAQQDAATVPIASLVATAPVRHDKTLYARWGDWFAWLNIAGLALLLFSPGRRRRALRV